MSCDTLAIMDNMSVRETIAIEALRQAAILLDYEDQPMPKDCIRAANVVRSALFQLGVDEEN